MTMVTELTLTPLKEKLGELLRRLNEMRVYL